MLIVLLLAPLLTGFVRMTKARMMRRRGAPLVQPYRDLVRLIRKEVVLADSASWLFRVIPYLIFAATWVAASLVPTFRTGLLFSWSADLIAIATHGRGGLARMLRGSVATAVMQSAKVSMLVLKPDVTVELEVTPRENSVTDEVMCLR